MKRLFFNSNSHLIKASSISTCRYNSIDFISILLTLPAFFPGNDYLLVIFSHQGVEQITAQVKGLRVCVFGFETKNLYYSIFSKSHFQATVLL